MGLGGTTKKLQKVIDAAEQLYGKMNEVIERLGSVEEDVEAASAGVDRLERELAEQRAIVEALAEQQGVDVEGALTEADLPPEPGDAQEDGASAEATAE